jgi:UDP-glucose 4-epimerase
VKALVTGGAGFIGSHVVDRLLATGHEPRIVDLLPSPWHEEGAVETVIGDLADPASVRAAVAGCDAIFHLAAMADVNEVVVEPVRTDAVNVRGTLNLLEAARAEGAGRLIYASTIWAYGNAPGPEPHDEDTPIVLPPHLYTATKLAGEMYCKAYTTLYGVETTVLRFGIPYGPRARPAAVIPAFIGKARRGEPLTIAGSGSQTRQFVYVEDLAEGTVAALAPVAAGRTYNLVGDELVSVRQIADTVRELVADVPILHGEERPADLVFGRASGERAAVELDWRPATPFDEGVRRYVEWLAVTNGSPVASAASSTAGSAAAVRHQEPSTL